MCVYDLSVLSYFSNGQIDQFITLMRRAINLKRTSHSVSMVSVSFYYYMKIYTILYIYIHTIYILLYKII